MTLFAIIETRPAGLCPQGELEVSNRVVLGSLAICDEVNVDPSSRTGLLLMVNVMLEGVCLIPARDHRLLQFNIAIAYAILAPILQDIEIRLICGLPGDDTLQPSVNMSQINDILVVHTH